MDYTDGVSHGAVYYPDLSFPWSGLIQVTDTGDSSAKRMYMDGVAYQIERPVGDYSFTVEAYTYPPRLDDQPSPMGFTYRDSRHLHLVYNPILLADVVSIGTDEYEPSATTFSFTGSTKPNVGKGPPITHLLVDRVLARQGAVDELEGWLYGRDDSEPRWPSIDEVSELFESYALLRIVDNGDGTWSAIGPSELIKMVSSTEFEITADSAFYLDSVSFIISSM